MSNKQETDLYLTINKIIDGGKDLVKGSTISRGQAIDYAFDVALKATNLQSVICKDCGEIITVEQLNNHSFIKIKGGGLIHWDC